MRHQPWTVTLRPKGIDALACIAQQEIYIYIYDDMAAVTAWC